MLIIQLKVLPRCPMVQSQKVNQISQTVLTVIDVILNIGQYPKQSAQDVLRLLRHFVVLHIKNRGMCILLGVLPLPSGTQSCMTLETC